MVMPRLIAHRGYPQHYPENTLIGLEAAIAAGARFVEVDAQISRDRVPVLFHDRDLKQLCGVDGAVHEHLYESLWRMRVNTGDHFRGVHIARLAELGHLLIRESEVTAFIEIKRVSLEHFGTETVLTLVRRSLKPSLEQCVLISYSLEALRVARDKGWNRIGAVIDRWEDRTQLLIREIRPEFIFCDVAGLPAEGKLGMEDMKLAVFEVADARQALALAARGVEYIETFAVGEMIRELSELTKPT